MGEKHVRSEVMQGHKLRSMFIPWYLQGISKILLTHHIQVEFCPSSPVTKNTSIATSGFHNYNVDIIMMVSHIF